VSHKLTDFKRAFVHPFARDCEMKMLRKNPECVQGCSVATAVAVIAHCHAGIHLRRVATPPEDGDACQTERRR